jgi:S-adenosylmethionine synthetase
LSVETFGTSKVPDDLILALIEKNFDFRPAAIIEQLKLRNPIYRQTAAYGHFGRDDIKLPWEKTDRAAALRNGAKKRA